MQNIQPAPENYITPSERIQPSIKVARANLKDKFNSPSSNLQSKTIQEAISEYGLDYVCGKLADRIKVRGGPTASQTNVWYSIGCHYLREIPAAWENSEKARVKYWGQLPQVYSYEQSHTPKWWRVVNLGQASCARYLSTMGNNVDSKNTYIAIDQFSDTNSDSFT